MYRMEYVPYYGRMTLNIAPRQNVPLHQMHMMALHMKTRLKPDFYCLSWSTMFEMKQSRVVDTLICELHVNSVTDKPVAVYDFKTMPRHVISFQLVKPSLILVRILVRSSSNIRIHYLDVSIARKMLLQTVSTIVMWDLKRVSPILMLQEKWRSCALSIKNQFAKLAALKEEMHTIQRAWADLFHANLEDLYGCTRTYCNGHVILGVSDRDRMCELTTDPPFMISTGTTTATSRNTTWFLRFASSSTDDTANDYYQPTYIHHRYFIWCFPDHQLKIAVARTISIEAQPQTKVKFHIRVPTFDSLANKFTPNVRPLLWLGFNFMTNLPYYNLWAMGDPRETMDVVDIMEAYAMLQLIETHFEANIGSSQPSILKIT